MKVVIFGTHPNQFNGYSKVVYELCKSMSKNYEDIQLHVFGFQNFHNHPGHRTDIAKSCPLLTIYDAFAEEVPKAAGFGVSLAKDYITRIKPEVVVIFNDLLVLTSVLNEIKDAPNRSEFKVISYIDQVYLSQRKDFITFLNTYSDAAMTFTPEWKTCILDQGLTIPTFPLPHGFNPSTYFPIPKHIARKFFGVPENDFLILNLNRNQPRKRWDICMQAFAEVIKRLPDDPIKLVIGTSLTGAWNLKELFERELRKRNVPIEKGLSKLVIPGHAQMLTDEETNFLYNIADIGINTCDGEGFGLCNFEQGGIGIPQIVTKLGGFLHFFDDKSALMVKPVISLYVDAMRDGVGGEAQIACPDAYADAIIEYYMSKQLMFEHGQRSRDNINKNFNWDIVSHKFYDIIKTVVSSQSTNVHEKQFLVSDNSDVHKVMSFLHKSEVPRMMMMDENDTLSLSDEDKSKIEKLKIKILHTKQLY